MRPVASKLPAITFSFWLIKIIATTLGETGGDWASMTMNVGYLISTVIFFGIFITALSIQLRSKEFKPFLYWTVIVSTSTAGTTMSDFMDRTLELGYAKGSALLILILALLLFSWKKIFGNLSVSNVQSRGSEFFYWITILVSNTLGTALGDFLADDSGLGFLGGWLLVSGILLAIYAASRFPNLNKVFLFWFAFILTRPFGATFGDLLTKDADKGGIGLGTGYSSLILIALLVICVIYTSKKQGSTATNK